jgi:hypothetical protein
MGKASSTHVRDEKYTTLKWILKKSGITMDAIMNTEVPYVANSFLNSLEATGFSKKKGGGTLHHHAVSGVVK